MARVRGGKYEDHGVRITEDGKNVYISSLMWNQNGKGSALIYLNKLTVKSISNIDKISAGDSTSSAMKGAVIAGAAGAVVGASMGNESDYWIHVEWK